MSPSSELVWVGSSSKDLRSFPKDVRGEIGFALGDVQEGLKPINAAPLLGFGGASVLEIKSDSDEGNTYRGVYTVKFTDRVYVLHCFVKKSTHGIKTSRNDVDLIRQRLKLAEEIHKQWLAEKEVMEPSLEKPRSHKPKRKRQ
jgi:phage-related protein